MGGSSVPRTAARHTFSKRSFTTTPPLDKGCSAKHRRWAIDYDNLVNLRGKDATEQSSKGLFSKEVLARIQDSIDCQDVGVVISIDNRKNIPVRKTVSDERLATTLKKHKPYPAGFRLDVDGGFYNAENLNLHTFSVGSLLVTPYLRTRLFELFHIWLSEIDFTQTQTHIFYDLRGDFPYQYSVPGEPRECVELYHRHGETDTSSPFWYVYFSAMEAVRYVHCTTDQDQMIILLLTLEHQLDIGADPSQRRVISDLTRRPTAMTWAYTEKCEVDEKNQPIERTPGDKAKLAKFRANAKKAKKAKLAAIPEDKRPWRDATQEEKRELGEDIDDTENDEQTRTVYVDMQLLREDVIKCTELIIDEYATLFMMFGTDWCTKKNMFPGFGEDKIEMAFKVYIKLKNFKFGDKICLKTMLRILFSDNVKWLVAECHKQKIKTHEDGYYLLHDIQRLLKERVEKEMKTRETKARKEQERKVKEWIAANKPLAISDEVRDSFYKKPDYYWPAQYVPVKQLLDHEQKMIHWQSAVYWLDAAKAEYTPKTEEELSEMKDVIDAKEAEVKEAQESTEEMQAQEPVVSMYLKCDNCGHGTNGGEFVIDEEDDDKLIIECENCKDELSEAVSALGIGA